ncbi:MAG: flagellar hook-associated protein FlgL [Nitrospina sp.]|jgi:flagellar hook-associated protein 3 FlgL|nr:flagellar hook-associated protein FlgL [Nitrospina sp.]MBT3875604.1 flagellar hook-associated protein FlgL [Nitrospina sp.]MBT4047583.1 flagellar hook-associated protein FlgL [Nitrospina sp.]MBT4556213.1 flagellar hook-associated protein FlgL [Nitrospina sp.]MBT5348590.1 flagellar hook-associated protein FlgL [Nitrospina sp.]
MVTRVTSQAQQANSLQNIFRITEDLFKAQQEIASGRRINKPSDDPAAIRDALLFRSSISQSNQFVRNIDNNRLYIQASDSALESVGVNLIRAKELAVSELGGLASSETRGFAANEFDQIISQIFESANVKIKNQFVFSGTALRTQPFEQSASGAVYFGNSERFQIAVGQNTNADFTIPGSEVLANDLNPKLTGSTSISSLNGGSGITPGSITITDRSGNSGTVSVSSSDTIDSLISKINALGGNVTASINSNGSGLQLTDGSSVISQALTVAEVSGGSTALDLGILGQRDGSLSGSDLNPGITSGTLISDLNGGDGLTLNQIDIVNGSASGTVTLSSATTIGDVISLIDSSSLNVTASINSSGNSLLVNSNSSSTVAIVKNVGTDETAENLGLGGGKNVFTTLFKMRDALRADDSLAILASLENLDSTLASVNNNRAVVGASLRRIELSDFTLEQSIVDESEQLAELEEADVVKSASDLANLQFALQATLSATAQILQPTLLDFLR